MRAVVTGAAGFLGRRLVEKAHERGWQTLEVVRAPTREGQVRADDLREGDLEGVDLFIHAAAVRHRHGASPHAYRSSNLELPLRLAKLAAGRVGRFVLVSSVGVYGWPEALPIDERTPFRPRTLYSQTKVDAEKALAAISALPLTIVRPTIIYGAGDTNGMLDKLAAMLRAGSYRLVGDGRNTLHHTHVDDVAEGIFTLGTAEAARGEDFILAGPETTTLKELSERVAKRIGVKVPRLPVPLSFARAVATAVDIAAYRGLVFDRREPPINNEKLDVMTLPIAFDASKARAAGFTATIGYDDGIARTLG